MITFEQVQAAVGPAEPDYEAAARLGPEALPHLDRLIFAGEDMALAMKATSLVGCIRDPQTPYILRRAALHQWPQVRAAAAHAARQLNADDAPEVLLPLLRDLDPAIRKVALRSVPTIRTESLRDAVAFIAANDPFPELREQARALSTPKN
jgi:HEAT repeat protein